MDYYVQVPKDLTKVKTKVLFNLTKRQLICFGSGGLVGCLFYFGTKHILGTTLATSIMVLLMLPFFLFGVYEKDGRPLEKILWNMIRVKYMVPGVRIYATENFYAYLQNLTEEEENMKNESQKKSKKKCVGRSAHPKDKRKKSVENKKK